MSPLLHVGDLEIDFHTVSGPVAAVRGVSFTLDAGDSLAIVGESGSGKTVTNRALLGLVDAPGEVRGSIRFDGTDVVGRSESDLRKMRGTGMAMVFQDSLDSLNPVFSVGSQLTEILRVRTGLPRRQARTRALELMTQVGIVDPENRIDDYPHQFSGGMRQRICIAMAIALNPRLLIADEPTTALDVTVQAGILRLLRRLQDERGMALIFVTHDLAVARLVARRVLVMYQGRIVEQGVTEDVFRDPRHPYTQALLAAHPARARTWRDLTPIPTDFATEPDLEAQLLEITLSRSVLDKEVAHDS
ncbi:ABC transporter ATP-binding protein [Nakamurella flavida]|uniref:ABC transporter ATP-binding protein n=1 Tax=Nakamurella flavida TaxID=363630 RepID=A0A938YN32_9ACTN|nr:ABC transporter ATP-binding protein [Nakamurella flavida]MBM9476397.1 ABC transporter ATP-binding protein [Nakamurella flavida]MDP9779502.1 peptide/nickel transport system ATP-binding protein/oligopeptide transport system ATP-binding protein [Nakamurella flavida]